MSGNNGDNTEKDLSEKEKMILENLYRCRDLELNNLWQKSAFLGALLALCFTGYGILILSMIKGEVKENMLLQYNILCFFLCFISTIFSVLWISMFKGSKAHYELYERAITDFEGERLKYEKKFVMGKFNYSIPTDESVFSTNGGNYSPSRINIFIGQLSLILWVLVSLKHICYIIFEGNILKYLQEHSCIHFIFVMILSVVFYKFIFFILKQNIKSSYLITNNKKEKGHYKKNEYS